jgi:hypothetical protein
MDIPLPLAADKEGYPLLAPINDVAVEKIWRGD